MRKFIIAANWKMNKGPKEAESFIESFISKIGSKCEHADVVIAPSLVSIPSVSKSIDAHPVVSLSAQNVSEHDSGAYTGETSVIMLKELYVQYVIVGHSERRSIYGETDEVINAKIKKVREANIRPIFCIGETLEEREAGKLEDVLRKQIQGGLTGVNLDEGPEVVIAYEPVWAIGTGVTASSQQAQDAHAFVRSVLADLYDSDTAEKIRIQYGGSVKPGNTEELMAMPDIDGALVGGASLDSESFFQIIDNAAKAQA